MKRFFTFFTALVVTAAVMTAQDGVKKYGVKSGTVKAVSEVMGQKVEATSYFDDYGAKEVSMTKMGGMDITTISRDGKSWLVNAAAKMVQEMPVQEQVNFLNLTDEIVAKYKIKETGKETVAGKECTCYSLELSQMGQTAKLKVCVWKGYTMKSVTSSMGMEVNAKVTEFTEGPVNAALFEVPEF